MEGVSDAELFAQAARTEYEETGIVLLGQDLAIVAAGEGQSGGTSGVIRELICLRGIGRTCLLPNGRPRYRFIGLFDNDPAGKHAVKSARQLDTSLLEFKDLFRLWPVMPLPSSLDPGTVQRTFERENSSYKGLDWELEDLLPPDFVDAFVSERPQAVARTRSVNGEVHRDFTRDGKASLHRFVKLNAMPADLSRVISALKAIRFYLRLKEG